MSRVAVLFAAALLGLAGLVAPSWSLAHQVSGRTRVVESVDAVAAPGLPHPSAAVTTQPREASVSAPALEEWRAFSGSPTVIPAALLWLGLMLSILAIASGRRWTIAAIARGRRWTIAAIARGRRWTIAAIAVCALAVLAFESGLHSVHHLGDDRATEQCSVAWASTHLGGTPAEVPEAVIAAVSAVEQSPLADTAAPISQPFRPDAGRAPPPLPLIV